MVQPLNVYINNHTSKFNLILHFFFVPLFMLGTILFVILFFIQPFLSVIGLAVMGISMTFQMIGHRFEENKPEPFAGPMDFIKRILIEQWILFPKYFFSGKYFKVLCGSNQEEAIV